MFPVGLDPKQLLGWANYCMGKKKTADCMFKVLRPWWKWDSKGLYLGSQTLCLQHPTIHVYLLARNNDKCQSIGQLVIQLTFNVFFWKLNQII